MLKMTMIPREELNKEHGISSRSQVQMEEDQNILAAMLQQEKAYRSIDYLDQIKNLKYQREEQQAARSKGGKGRKDVSSQKVVDEFCRDQIVEWKYRVMDYFKIDREIVAISMSYLDRFLSEAVHSRDRRAFKRAATASLHLAVKVHVPDKLRCIGVLSDLSRGEFEMSDIIATEGSVSKTINWRLHPPTAICVTSTLISILPSIPSSPSIKGKEIANCLLDFSLFFAELSVCNYSLSVIQKTSTIAVASLFNAMEGLGLLSSVEASSSFLRDFVEKVGEIAPDASLDLDAIEDSKELLWKLYENSEEYSMTKEEEEKTNATKRSKTTKNGGRDSPSGIDDDKISVVSDSSSPICVSRLVRAEGVMV